MSNLVLKIRNHKESYWKVCYVFSIFLIFIALILNVAHHPFRSKVVVVFGLLVSLVGFFCLVLFTNEKEEKYFQLLPCYLLFSLFWNMSAASGESLKYNFLIIIFGIITFTIPLIYLIYYVLFKNNVLKRLYKAIFKNWQVVLVISLFIILSLETLNDWPKLDTDIYYYYLDLAKNWDFSFDSLSLFRLGDHQSMGYTIWGIIGIYLTPTSVAGLRIINILMYCISIGCVYGIISKFNITNNNFLKALYTSVFAFNPLVLGLVYEVNLDTPSTCFYIWVVCAYMYKKDILLCISAFLLVFSKETGIILLFGVATGWVFTLVYKFFKGRKAEIKNWRQVKLFFIFLSPAVCFLVFSKLGMLWRQKSNSLAIEENSMDKIGIHLENSIMKTKQLLGLNFAWIMALVIVIGILSLIIVRIKTRKQNKEKSKVHIEEYFPILISFVLFIGFQYIYITYCTARYITPYLLGFTLLFTYVLGKAFKEKLQIIFCALVVGLLLCQNFFTLDPVSRKLFTNVNIGQTEINTTRTFVRSSQGAVQTKKTNPELIPYFELTQSAACNRQFTYFGDAFEEFLRRIEYDNATYIAVAPIYEEMAGMTWTSLFGKWYDHNLYYDFKTKHVVSNSQKPIINMGILTDEAEIDFDKYERVYLITFPYNNLYEVDPLLQDYEIVDSFKVYKKMWEIDVYQLQE